MCANAIRRIRLGRSIYIGFGAVASLVWIGSAHADEPVKVNEPKVLQEPGEVTDVVDAFDGDDPFDLHITVGYQHTWHNANIRRETSIDQPGLSTGGYKADTMNVAAYSETTSRLNTRIDVGLYKDLALYLRMPVILSNSRGLDGLDGSDRVQSVALAASPIATDSQLFYLPFRSPNRSGIEYLAVGFDANIFNQARDLTKPTWLFGFEGRFNVSEPMHACNTNPAIGQVQCADPSDINRNGRGGDVLPGDTKTYEGSPASERKAGVSRGVHALEVHTLLSRRFKYLEPYGGFRAMFEFPTGSSDFGQSDFQGALVNHPPLEGWVILGIQVIPWEHREQFQRVTFDARIQGAYRSEGRDYSELFDALGSTSALSMRRPNYADYQYINKQSVVNEQSQKVYFTGLTDVQAHGKFGAYGGVTWQAGEYVKFQVGLGYVHVQSHFVTMDQPCNPDFQSDASRAGPCHNERTNADNSKTITTTGIPNPNYRPQINHVGERFKVDDSSLLDLWINGIMMF
jgi:hypothetical protein